MTASLQAFLVPGEPVETVPLESLERITWSDPRTGQRFVGYQADVDALSRDALEKIYSSMKSRFSDLPAFDSWVVIIKMEGLPIREERIAGFGVDMRLLL